MAAKYGFDATEAERELNLGELKIQRKRGPVAKKSVTKPEKKAKKATKAKTAKKPAAKKAAPKKAAPKKAEDKGEE